MVLFIYVHVSVYIYVYLFTFFVFFFIRYSTISILMSGLSFYFSRSRSHTNSYSFFHSPLTYNTSHIQITDIFILQNSIYPHVCMVFYSFFVCLLSMPSTSNTLCIVIAVIMTVINVMIANQARVIFRWDTLTVGNLTLSMIVCVHTFFSHSVLSLHWLVAFRCVL